MIPKPAERAIRLVPAALFVLVSVIAVAPASTAAGCSHYSLTAEGPQIPEMLALEILELGAALPPSPRDPSPCSGPSCRNGPSSPRLPASPLTTRSEPWCSTASDSRSSAPESSDKLGETILLAPHRLGNSIERPPRLLAPIDPSCLPRRGPRTMSDRSMRSR